MKALFFTEKDFESRFLDKFFLEALGVLLWHVLQSQNQEMPFLITYKGKMKNTSFLLHFCAVFLRTPVCK